MTKNITEGDRMKSVRVLTVCLFMVAFISLMVIAGCSPERTGTAIINSPPQVFIVNTPPDSAQFSRNPELNWYATDNDGFIEMYRYSVILDSNLIIGSQIVTPEVFISQAADDQFGWIELEVDLDNPQSSASVRLFADTLDPENNFITQYFFVQAIDDKGAHSSIAWRRYSRNNHYPNTHFKNSSVYINAKDTASPAPGITMSWSGADSADWGRAEPPLEYEWRLYGPFDTAATIYIEFIKENCVWDPTVDSFINCVNIPVLNLEALPPSILNIPQPIKHSKGPNFAGDPTDVWVSDLDTKIYDVFGALDLPETSKYKFIFWVRARDDGFVPDPSPSFGQYYVVEAMFEKSVAILDETGYTGATGRWGPRHIDTARAAFRDLVHSAGYTDFDETRGVDYFHTANKPANGGGNITAQLPDLLDNLSHKVLILYNDDAFTGPVETAFGLMPNAFFALDMGASSWMMARNIGDFRMDQFRGETVPKSLQFQKYFGFASFTMECWFATYWRSRITPEREFNEEFIEAISFQEGFPNITVDYGPPVINGSDTIQTFMQSRYDDFFFEPSGYIFSGLPEVGVGERVPLAAPMYLYHSKNGEHSIFNGKVCGVRMQNGDMRTACFSFSPLAMDTTAMRETFSVMLPWLTAKFEDQSAMKVGTNYSTAHSDMSERRYRIQLFLDYLDQSATPEEVTRYGIDMKPFVVTPN